MNRLSIIFTILIAIGLASCKSHKATVVRATGKPVAASTVKAAPAVPKNAATKREYANDKKISNELVKQARTWIGTPYRYGANTKKKGTDCSGMTMTLFKEVANLSLPRNSAAQCEYCFNVPRNSLEPGDLVFFTSSTKGGKVSHVGLYIGNGKMIHASTSRGVIESALDEKYYASHYHSSGRVYGITYAATGGKKPKSGDRQEVLLASEGVKAAAKKDDKTDKANKSNKSNKTNKSNKVNKRKAAEITLDEFVAKQQSKPLTDTVIVVEEMVAQTVASIDSASVMIDSIKAKVEVVDTVAAPVKKQVTTPGPTMIVNGKRVQATEVERVPEKQPATTSADTVKAEAIKQEVVKAMRFGK